MLKILTSTIQRSNLIGMRADFILICAVITGWALFTVLAGEDLKQDFSTSRSLSLPHLKQGISGYETQDEQGLDLQYKSKLYQIVVVKASTLMPPPLQRQILRHRQEILLGSLDGLRAPSNNDEDALIEIYGNALTKLRNKAPFSSICYDLGRLSTTVSEFGTLFSAPAQTETKSAFQELILQSVQTFPLVVTREGEAYLLQRSLPAYLQYISRRRDQRLNLLSQVLEDSKPEEWSDQRSLAYGLATLIYNDMVLDSARLWLLLWQEAGGDIANAPYFRLNPAWEKK